MTFEQFFTIATTYSTPRPWQRELALSTDCSNRLIHVPTGQGKTEGVALAWLWNRIAQGSPVWPRRLVWCLPMRVLVEQTASRLEVMLTRLSQELGAGWPAIHVHRLLGGSDTVEWHLAPDAPAVFVGTQDMLLSRALNRGYACPRARWPVEYGMLNQDCLWVLDEVQLMDVGLVTSVQLQAFRQRPSELRSARSWWMSATLQPAWLSTPESAGWLPALEGQTLRVRPADTQDSQWQAQKPVRVELAPAKQDPRHARLAALVWDAHTEEALPHVTIVVVNRVETAANVSREVRKLRDAAGRATDVRLVHSRFRGRERRHWPAEFLNRRDTEHPEIDRIIVATQVIEAGVDISCTRMVTELAPWASLVQRFGRVARYGGHGSVTVVDRDVSVRDAAPYDASDLAAARDALGSVSDVGLAALGAFEGQRDEQARARLYPYAPLHILNPREHEELFDTAPDLSGADVDISRFIRTGEERDVSIAWVATPGDDPPEHIEPHRDDLCPVAVWRARDWLLANGSLKPACRAWVWDYLDDRWRTLKARDLYPGQVVLVSADWGGYDVQQGFTGEPVKTTGLAPDPIMPASASSNGAGDRAEARDDLSQTATAWMTIATHGQQVGRTAADLASAIGLNPELGSLLDLCGRLHDWGKAHPVFQSSIRPDGWYAVGGTRDLAKAPDAAWLPRAGLYPENDSGGVRRRGFRHELASALGFLELLSAIAPTHAGLIGPFLGTGLVDDEPLPTMEIAGNRLLEELSCLSAEHVDLVIYLIAAHHGKVRAALHVMPHDQEYPLEKRDPGLGLPVRGVREGDILPAVRLSDRNGVVTEVPAVRLSLAVAALGLSRRYGPGWTERVIELRHRMGPASLAFLEAILRAADVRASRAASVDPLIAVPVLS